MITMKTKLQTIMITGFVMFAFCHLAWGQKTISHITAVQRPGTKLVDISYNLNYGDAQRVKVGLQVSSNGGASWNVIASSVTGDVGLNVVSGTGKRIVWDAGADWNGQHAGNILYRITANRHKINGTIIADGLNGGIPAF
jgi:hypothetical protein